MTPDYKKMYFLMVDAGERAMNIIIEAQRQCEKMYIDAEEDETEQDSLINELCKKVSGK